jgi:CheY-like chemotaxis protein
VDSLPKGSSLDDFDVVLMDGPDVAASVSGENGTGFPVILMVPPGTSVMRSTGRQILRLRKPLQESPLLSAVCRALQIDAPPWLLGEEQTEFAPAPAVVKARVGQRILVVEDNELNRRLSVEVLRRKGYAVDTAASGIEALEMVAALPYSVILMDCQMPELDGYDTSTAIRSFEGDGRRVPIVAVTAHALAGEKERCLSSGMDDFLAKPYFPDQLLAVVEKWS